MISGQLGYISNAQSVLGQCYWRPLTTSQNANVQIDGFRQREWLGEFRLIGRHDGQRAERLNGVNELNRYAVSVI